MKSQISDQISIKIITQRLSRVTEEERIRQKSGDCRVATFLEALQSEAVGLEGAAHQHLTCETLESMSPEEVR